VEQLAALLPPLVAIGVALATRRTLLALFLGVWSGAVARPWLAGEGVGTALVSGSFDVFRVYLWNEASDSFRIEILGFIAALLAMVAVMSRAGGVAGLVDLALRYARGRRSAMLLTWGSGLAVFFDDLANCMLVGSSLRPLCDRLRISREKLAYLVDSTAAPVAGLSLLSTWVAFQISLYEPLLPSVGIERDALMVFAASLPYRSYCWLALAFGGLVAWTGRDFGPMRRAEERATRTGELVRPGARAPLAEDLVRMEPAPGMPRAPRRAWLPVAVTLLVTAVGVAWTGNGAWSIFLGSLAGLLSAVTLASLPPGLAPREILRAMAASGSTLGYAVTLLFLAWMIGAVCRDVGTADTLVALLGERLPAAALPLLLFLIAAAVAFATGSSWSTMSILVPNAVPLAAALGGAQGELLVLLAIGAVLDGAIFGDHCSPISDTTVLSSVASGCDHLDHVRTQLPYALAVAVVAAAVGYAPALLWPAWGAWPGLAAGVALLAGGLRWGGRRPGPAPSVPA